MSPIVATLIGNATAGGGSAVALLARATGVL